MSYLASATIADKHQLEGGHVARSVSHGCGCECSLSVCEDNGDADAKGVDDMSEAAGSQCQ